MRVQTPAGWLRHDLTHRGVTAWLLTAVLTAFYIGLYFSYAGNIKNFMATPLSQLPGNWTVFGVLIAAGIAGALAQLIFKAREEGRSPAPAAMALRVLAVFAVFAVFYVTLHGTGGFLTWAIGALGNVLAALLGEKGRGLVSQWTIYGLLYSIAIVGGGIYVISKYRHNRYQIVRTSVVMFVQVTLAFSLPLLLKFMDQPEYYFSYIWPLKHDYLWPDNLRYHAGKSVVYVLYSLFAAILLVPLAALFFGKRWYCSWVCGCGGLANTFGEPWRHLSSKTSTAWGIEKFTIHAVLVAVFVVTALTGASVVVGNSSPRLAAVTSEMRVYYGLIVGTILSGIVGVGVYPVGGTRVWCRFACPMAALLGLTQKFGRFRIHVKEDMCISCGMCSKYCEMGIDVRSYAQANQTFTRASCVGCGLCSEVCPRGVLRLENVTPKDPQELVQIRDVKESYKGGFVSIGALN